MENQDSSSEKIRALVQWATTLPQAVAVYFACLLLVLGLSFYAGTLKPKKPAGMGPPPASVPRN
jgi:hypothetical protein